MSGSSAAATTAELQELLGAIRKALALLAHTAAAQQDARPFLESLLANYRHAMKPGQVSQFDELATAMLMAVSSVALQQHPDDPEVQNTYRGLRPGKRH